jgi:hypothetical protein
LAGVASGDFTERLSEASDDVFISFARAIGKDAGDSGAFAVIVVVVIEGKERARISRQIAQGNDETVMLAMDLDDAACRVCDRFASCDEVTHVALFTSLLTHLAGSSAQVRSIACRKLVSLTGAPNVAMNRSTEPRKPEDVAIDHHVQRH